MRKPPDYRTESKKQKEAAREKRRLLMRMVLETDPAALPRKMQRLRAEIDKHEEQAEWFEYYAETSKARAEKSRGQLRFERRRRKNRPRWDFEEFARDGVILHERNRKHQSGRFHRAIAERP